MLKWIKHLTKNKRNHGKEYTSKSQRRCDREDYEQNKHKSCIVSNWWSKYILFALLNTKIRKYNHMELKKVKIMRFDVRDEESEYLSLKSFTFVSCFTSLFQYMLSIAFVSNREHRLWFGTLDEISSYEISWSSSSPLPPWTLCLR